MKRWMWIALICAGVAGCKQGRGDRCQITADCQDPLICSQATGTCTDMTTGGIDATIPDAPPRMDAGVDAPRDAPRDSMLVD